MVYCDTWLRSKVSFAWLFGNISLGQRNLSELLSQILLMFLAWLRRMIYAVIKLVGAIEFVHPFKRESTTPTRIFYRIWTSLVRIHTLSPTSVATLKK